MSHTKIVDLNLVVDAVYSQSMWTLIDWLLHLTQAFTFCKRFAYMKGFSKCDDVHKTVLAGIMFSIRRQYFKGHILANIMLTMLPFSYLQVWTLQFPCRSCCSIPQSNILNQQQTTPTSLLLQELVTISNFQLSRHVFKMLLVVVVHQVMAISYVETDNASSMTTVILLQHWQMHQLICAVAFFFNPGMIHTEAITMTTTAVTVTPTVKVTPSSTNFPTSGT